MQHVFRLVINERDCTSTAHLHEFDIRSGDVRNVGSLPSFTFDDESTITISRLGEDADEGPCHHTCQTSAQACQDARACSSSLSFFALQHVQKTGLVVLLSFFFSSAFWLKKGIVSPFKCEAASDGWLRKIAENNIIRLLNTFSRVPGNCSASETIRGIPKGRPKSIFDCSDVVAHNARVVDYGQF